MLSNPVGGAKMVPGLVIDRIKGNPATSTNFDPLLSREIFGVLGVVQLITGQYLVAIAERQEVGYINNAAIYKMAKALVVAIPRQCEYWSEEERRQEREYLKNLNNFLDQSEFYFSLDYDITRRVQHIVSMTAAERAQPLWQRVDDRFFWNKHISRSFIEAKLDEWILPVMDGFIHVEVCEVGGLIFDYILMSRRSCFRTGARYQTRGADPQGRVANFVETEQIVVYGKIQSAFVQTRGSIPVIWHQKGKGLKPKPSVQHSLFARTAFQAHFEEQMRCYGKQLLINLIDQRGNERDVGEAYETQVRLLNHPDISYIPFDFHEVCKNMKYENLQLLTNESQPYMDRFRYALVDAEGKLVTSQDGVVRTNCIDCLDRTNVVQSTLARLMLQVQLEKLGILSFVRIQEVPTLDSLLKNVWADNADIMSKQYTGTGALKTDYTRTGRRSVRGTITDGVNSTKRFMNKNFKDEEKQVSSDLFLGRFQIERRRYDELFQFDGASNSYYIATKGARLYTDGVFKFPVYLVYSPVIDPTETNTRKKLRLAAVLEVSPAGQGGGTLMSYVLTMFSKKEYSLTSLKQIIRDFSYNRALKLLFDTSARTYDYIFSSVEAREQFIQVVTGIQRSMGIEPTVYLPQPVIVDVSEGESPKLALPSQPDHHLQENISVFTASWNMESAVPPFDFSGWLEKGHDVYVIGVQNCLYAVLGDMAFSCKAHWAYVLQAHLGDEYLLLAHQNTGADGTALVLLAKKTHASKITNLRTTYAEEVRTREMMYEKKTAFAVKERLTPFMSKLTGSWKKDRDSSRMQERDRPVSLSMDKEPQGLPPSVTGISEEPKVDPKYFGEVISFYFNGTALCFVNTKRRDCPFKLAGKGDEDLATDFLAYHHVIWMGDISPVAVDSTKWIDLFVDEAHGSVLWRSLPECFVSHVQAHVATAAIAQAEEGKSKSVDRDDAFSSYREGGLPTGKQAHAPIGVNFQIPTLVFPPVAAKRNVSIILTDLKGERLVGSTDFMRVGRLEPYILFDAPFIEIGRRTSVQSSEFPEWREIIKLRPIFTDIGFLRQQHLRMLVMDKDTYTMDGVVGLAVISLKRACGDQPMEFSTVITMQDKPMGHLTGKIHIVLSSIMSPKADRTRSLARQGSHATSSSSMSLAAPSPLSSPVTPPLPARPHASASPRQPPAFPTKPLPPHPGSYGGDNSSPLSSPHSSGAPPLPPKTDDHGYPTSPLPQPPVASSFLSSALDTTSHITTSLSSTFTSAIDSTKQGIPSLMGWFGGGAGAAHTSPMDHHNQEVQFDPRGARSDRPQSPVGPQHHHSAPSMASSTASGSSSSAFEPSLIHFGDDPASATASSHQQQAQTKRRTETVDDLLS